MSRQLSKIIDRMQSQAMRKTAALTGVGDAVAAQPAPTGVPSFWQYMKSRGHHPWTSDFGGFINKSKEYDKQYPDAPQSAWLKSLQSSWGNWRNWKFDPASVKTGGIARDRRSFSMPSIFGSRPINLPHSPAERPADNSGFNRWGTGLLA